MSEHDAGLLLWTYEQDISRFVNTLTDARGVTVYTAEEIAAIEPDREGFVAVGEYLHLSPDGEDAETWYVELNPATGELRESY